MDTKCTTKATIEEVLIRDLIKAKNPGVDFQIQMGIAGIEEVLVDGRPVDVSFSGEIFPRKLGESYGSFYAANVNFSKIEAKAARREHRPPCQCLDHYLLNEALHLKNPDKKFSVACCDGKLVGIICDDLHEYKPTEKLDGNGIIKD
ncbi:MAG: hypothetical protein J6J36_05180 [Clostridia bacterium]|nr:hypothetical protein [Clostridia bacterium]